MDLMNESILLVYCTAADEKEARMIAKTVVDKQLAACCNIVPLINSVYSWEGETKESSEALLLIKTTIRLYEQLEKEIKMIHSYSVPEIIATKIETGSAAYFDWIIESMERKG
jgi:periplasmic divalent cation tolerance protein